MVRAERLELPLSLSPKQVPLPLGDARILKIGGPCQNRTGYQQIFSLPLYRRVQRSKNFFHISFQKYSCPVRCFSAFAQWCDLVLVYRESPLHCSPQYGHFFLQGGGGTHSAVSIFIKLVRVEGVEPSRLSSASS